MPRPAKNLDSLVRGRVRASMSKYNLFNLYKKRNPFYSNKSQFQQKWMSKQETRAYHGEHLIESRFKNIFDSQLQGVAQLDASLGNAKDVQRTPLKLQAFAALERRLDVALFRSMFASSVRQARQFILSASVKVNDVKIAHPSYLLSPGDVFSVQPDKVMTALGRTKPSLKKSLAVDTTQIAMWNSFVKKARADPKAVWDQQQKKQQERKELTKHLVDNNTERKHDLAMEKKLKQVKALQKATTKQSVLRDVLVAAQSELTEASFKKFGADAEKCLKIHEMIKDHEIAKASDAQEAAETWLGQKKEALSEAEFTTLRKVAQLANEVALGYQKKLRTDLTNESKETGAYDPDWAKELTMHKKLTKEDVVAILEDESPLEKLKEFPVSLHFQKNHFGLADPKKPFFTPWAPRQFLAPFAIHPHHIEIDWTTCHAVYLRDPVARPGHSEVITPFGEDIHERAYMYYARKGL
ncbi:hypothetical protein BABINDRAFT_6721 [Babjeviella inositovora NRRL Y-12698]|uniref:Small ribosomal subunit protein uS4m n=1 Tax=Babjeviella inositovora NRRL Y-12698 TaxID=984486 RepID=A0A1E3QWQ3_9ASCO|nr:uncharacterized protein BABINDRAFT_6721 [Babjeviella inositovora NRRL Y-12698]ODQ82113.1 hypothetical protein BABINDRAFT_6721 [Babjeviella inositovora NRRL Y-12698]